jgi:hypothetical protein
VDRKTKRQKILAGEYVEPIPKKEEPKKMSLSVVCHKDKFIYVPVLGCGNERIVKTITSVTGVSRIDYIDDDYIKNPGYFTFTFVKNPLNRLCEFYVNNITKTASEVQLGVDELTKRANHMSFEDFITRVSEIEPKELIEAIRPASLIPEVDFVGKCENAEEDIDKLCNTIGQGYGGDWWTEIQFDDIHQEFFTLNNFPIVREHYQKDLERFEYETY